MDLWCKVSPKSSSGASVNMLSSSFSPLFSLRNNLLATPLPTPHLSHLCPQPLCVQIPAPTPLSRVTLVEAHGSFSHLDTLKGVH